LLPTVAKIAPTPLSNDDQCKRCGALVETILHVLQDCQVSREILMLSGINDGLLNVDFVSCIDWLEIRTSVLDK
ncbi:hypothetical protein Golob_018140, partial [Gossypium lobatum]|nr:hypothetical protein [Gossypium lobatum]